MPGMTAVFIAGAIFCVLTGVVLALNARNIVSLASPVPAYLFLTVYPLLLLAFPLSVLYPALFMMMGDFLGMGLYLLLFLLVLLLAGYFSMKLNITPIALGRIKGRGKRSTVFASGRQLLRYAAYGSILYTVITASLIRYYVLCVNDSQEPLSAALLFLNRVLFLGGLQYTTDILRLPTAFYPLHPFYQTAANTDIVLFAAEILFLTLLVLALSLNGAVRLMCASKRIRKRGALYIILLLIPAVNLVCISCLCGMAKRHLGALKPKESGGLRFKKA